MGSLNAVRGKTLAIALPFPGLWDPGEAAGLLARFLRAADRSIRSDELFTFPWLDGGRGTIDLLVTQSLGSFLEVETTDAMGGEIIVPLGFAGEDGKLAVIEMSRVAHVARTGEAGTTAGIGELIQDALDEGAFSILLCHEEPLACDAGLGAASALGVKFFDQHDKEIVFPSSGHSHQPLPVLSDIARVDVSSRSFTLLSSRVYIARWSSNDPNSTAHYSPTPELLSELQRLAEIIQRDTGIPPSIQDPSASAIEFGLQAFLGAEVREGHALVLEASGIEEAIGRGEFSSVIVLAPSISDIETVPFKDFLDFLRTRIDRRAIIFSKDDQPSPNSNKHQEPHYSLADVTVFQAPIGPNANVEELRRDFGIRLEKLLPTVLSALKDQQPTKGKATRVRNG
jgi:glycerate 2-kinase